MYVFDTSAFINGWNEHYESDTFPTVWGFIGEKLREGSIVAPREAFEEINAQDDDLGNWVDDYEEFFTFPTEEVGRLAGEIQGQFPRPGERNGADPFVIAEAQVRGLTVVTYEGRSFDGRRTRNWSKRMPGVCDRFGVPCCTLPEGLKGLGARI